MHVLVATPTYDAKVTVGYMMSIIGLIQLLRANDIDIDIKMTSNTLIPRSRDELAYMAMSHPTVTHLLFIDADVSFNQDVPAALMERCDLPIVAAVYPRRNALPIQFPVAPLDAVEKTDARGSLKVAAAPTGMMLIRKDVLVKVAEASPIKYANRLNPNGIPHIFEELMYENHLMGEDFSFCIKAKRCGFDTYVVPGLLLSHEGSFQYSGAWNGKPETIAVHPAFQKQTVNPQGGQ